MRIYPEVGLQAADILLPGDEYALSKWAVVACDQFTSEPHYWEKVDELTKDHPSTYHLILPEAYLGKEKGRLHQEQINPSMNEYLNSGILRNVEGFIYIERSTDTGIRKGLITALDLEKYDFNANSTSLIRATEGTIVDRLPPRIAIRENAILEVPHILVLIDDPDFTVIKPISDDSKVLKKLYDFDLMANGGHLRGFLVDHQQIEQTIVSALKDLASPEKQKTKYGIVKSPLLYAVGDGNHSLATAKSIWENIKDEVDANHPARYALVELVNIHDPSIVFEPIHRLLNNIEFDLHNELSVFFNGQLGFKPLSDYSLIIEKIRNPNDDAQIFGIITQNQFEIVSINNPPHTLIVGSIQKFLDYLLNKYSNLEIDYIHGDDVISELGSMPGSAGFVLPAMDKFKLFKSVIKDGPLPRKTFSMGEANEKRYYLECRRIKDE